MGRNVEAVLLCYLKLVLFLLLHFIELLTLANVLTFQKF